MYLEPVNTVNLNINRRVKTSLSTFLDDSDSENEEGAMEKLAAAISDLFTGTIWIDISDSTINYWSCLSKGDWNENEDSECEHSSEDENDISESGRPKEPNQEQTFGKCVYFIINAKDTLNVTITPTFLKVNHISWME